MLGAFEKKYLYPKGTMQMVTDYMNFLNEFTAFTKRRGVVDKQDHRRASLIDLLPNGQKIERGYMSEVIAVTFKDNPNAAHPYSQQIYTPNGIISWGEVKIGTELFTEFGGTTLVEEILEKGEKEIYEFTFNDGRTVRSTEDHKWNVVRRCYSGKKTKKVNNGLGQLEFTEKTITTSEIFAMVNVNTTLNNKPKIKLPSPIQLPERETAVDAYTLGLLLGDGCFTRTAKDKAYITMMWSDLDDLKKFIPYTIINCEWDQVNRKQNQIVILGCKEEFRKLGLLDKYSHNKFIPEIYKFNSEKVRWDVLNGLLDSDGSVTKDFGVIEYSSNSEQLANDVVWICHSLGLGASKKSRIIKGKVYYRVYIYCKPDETRLFNLERKKQRIKLKKFTGYGLNKSSYIQIEKVEVVGVENSKCVNVSNPSHLYLVGDFIPTHNCRGKDADLVLFEEAGKFDNLKDSYLATKPTVESGDMTTGQMIVFGTGGEMDSGTIDLESMFYNPDPYNILPFENIWDDGGRGTFCGFFHPCHLNKDGFTDKDGNSLITQARESEDVIRERIKRTSKDPGTFDRHIIEYPFKPAESFLTSGGNIFPLGAVIDHKNYLTRSSITQYIGVNGVTFRDNKNKVKFRPSSEVRPVMTFPHDMKVDNSGCVVIYQSPYMESGKVPDNLYVICHDPYGQNLDGPSLGVAYVLKRPNNLSSPDDMIVASYVGRPSSQDEYNKNLFELAELYNARIGFENDRGDVISFAKRFRKLDWLEEEFELGYNSSLPKSQVRRLYGMHMTDARKRQGEIYLRDWLLQERSTDIDGNKLLNLHTIYDVALLDELRTYNPKKGNFDRVSAMLIGMYYFKEIEFKQLHVMVEQAFSDDSFFNRSLF